MADDTIGIELEFLNAGFTEFGEANHTGWKVETDGSVRHHAGRYTWIDDERFFPTRTEFGGEIISPILRFNNGIWRKIIPVMELLQDFGEVSKAANSIHIHFGIQGMGTPKLCKLFSWLKDNEAVFFDVSAPGEQEPRGAFNDYIYYRPLISPQWAVSSDRENTCFKPSLGRIENATSKSFAYSIGRHDTITRKWVAPRYCGINYVSIIRNHTLEFRMFNFTSDFLQVKAWVMMIEGFMSLVRKGVFTTSVEDMVLEAAGKCGASTKEVDAVLPKLKRKSIYKNIDMTPIYTHTSTRVDWEGVYPEVEPLEYSTVQPREVRNPHPMNLLELEEFLRPISLNIPRRSIVNSGSEETLQYTTDNSTSNFSFVGLETIREALYDEPEREI